VPSTERGRREQGCDLGVGVVDLGVDVLEEFEISGE
jgi:hypothetical protein